MNSSLETQLGSLEVEAERAEPGMAAHLLNRAGDICLAAGDRQRALTYYGRGIDANLYGRRFDAAIGLCHKLLRVAPNAVRTRCTLSWLALGRGDLTEIVNELGEYVTAAIASGEQERAVHHLTRMARATGDRRIHELIAAHLERLGRAEAAADVRRTTRVPGAPARPLGDEARDALWSKVINGALTAPPD
jgi:tetratricopeptide (TPR) repeat protein